ncbi:hypothetical protein [Aquimarina agarilytica]|uniref:hypothetical protein n=1 Tax=Aquimarina agarilytica TaxID=1087449 RepID=UPI000287F830|nr:hypothetical protein [Aquimarina agarilytica]
MIISRNYLVGLIIFISLISCEKDENFNDANEQTLNNQSGFIKNFVATRGDYQWLVGIKNGIDTTYYFDKNLDKKYKSDYLEIKVNANMTNDSTVIYKPLPNDIPTTDFKVRNIEIINIKVVKN